ncbi:hypothetical protein TB1_018921 [Malus domestica]|uniref:Uncharacterized protein n=1 Tax=Malus domestica TaxID=3750 RepID=A0A498HTF4_MALDO|nr:hypothetical protein DVH24_016852 [Malus domestica]
MHMGGDGGEPHLTPGTRFLEPHQLPSPDKSIYSTPCPPSPYELRRGDDDEVALPYVEEEAVAEFLSKVSGITVVEVIVDLKPVSKNGYGYETRRELEFLATGRPRRFFSRMRRSIFWGALVW